MNKQGISRFFLYSIIASFFIISFAGCMDSRKDNLREGIDFIKKLPKKKISGLMVREYNADNDPYGLVMLYCSSLPTNSKYPRACISRRELGPWTILVLPGNRPKTMILEGYGEDIKNPIFVDEVVFQ